MYSFHKTSSLKALILTALLLFPGSLLCADGMMFTYKDTGTAISSQTVITENSQRVLLIHDSESKTQKTVIEVRSAEAAGDFIWIIPVVNEDDLTMEEFKLLVKEEPDCGEMFNALSSAAGPEITVIRHELLESYQNHYSSPFACSTMVGDLGEYEEGEVQTDEASLNNWAQIETNSFLIDMVKGEARGEEILHWLETEGLTDIKAVLTEIAAHYSQYTNIGYLILRSNDSAVESINTGISFTTRNSTPFFPLEISRPGFNDSMSLEIYIGEEADVRWKPKGACQDYLWNINLESGYYTSLSREDWMNSNPEDAPGNFYGLDYYYAAYTDQELYEEALEGLENYDNYNYYYNDETHINQEAWFQSFSGTLNESQIAVITGLDNHTSATALELTVFSRKVLSKEDLVDLTFDTDKDEDYRGGMRIHIAVGPGSLSEAEPMAMDFGLFLPLLFPAGMAIGRFRRKKKF